MRFFLRGGKSLTLTSNPLAVPVQVALLHAKKTMNGHPIRILLISSVVPDEASMGGHLILKRHFDNPQLTVRVVNTKQHTNKRNFRQSIRQYSGQQLAEVVENLWPELPDPNDIDSAIADFRPDLILSVAHGWAFEAAAIAAKRNRLPFVLWCQDWWPDFLETGSFVRALVEKRFRKACKEATRIICVSKGMHEELGNLPNSTVLHDLPSTLDVGPKDREIGKPFTVVYGGNVWVYGEILAAAALEFLDSDKLRLEVYGGPRPIWPAEVFERMRATDCYHGLMRPNAFLKRALRADAFLIPMSFDPRLKRRMQTSFLSKMIELAQLGIPLVLWGPKYCSAVRWAQERDSALCVTDPSPASLRVAVEDLSKSPEAQNRLSCAALEAAQQEFNPTLIRNSFVQLLNEVKSL